MVAEVWIYVSLPQKSYVETLATKADSSRKWDFVRCLGLEWD